MVKNESKPLSLLKECYGTNEWSENSGICRNCKLKEACGKAKLKNAEGI